jgi:ParB family transcriptional regulator, chromosome partitioning protein
MKHVPWTALAELRGDLEILRKIDEAEALLKSLRKTPAS